MPGQLKNDLHTCDCESTDDPTSCECEDVNAVCEYDSKIVPVCNIDFFIATELGFGTNSVDYKLSLTKNVVKLKNIPCNVKSLILGLPIIMFSGCKLYKIKSIPYISSTDFTVVNNYIKIKSGANSADLPIINQLQSNGYQYIEINVTDYGLDLPATCDLKCDFTLVFDEFCLPLTPSRLYTNCAIRCNPIIWTYSCVATPVIAE